MSANLDNRMLRDVMGRFATGVCVLATNRPDGKTIGMTVNSFSSVSLDPPLVLVCLSAKSSRSKHFIEAEQFSIAILGEDQESVSNHFSQPGEGLADGVEIESGETGVPVIQNCAANIECKFESVHEGGDHFIVVGRVAQTQHNKNARPLLYYQGAYRGLDQEETA